MADQWMLRGTEFTNCNCAWGCPCQFGSPTTHGHCEAIIAGAIDEGHFNGTRLDGLKWVLFVSWPGEIADGNGTEQAVIDAAATPEQRDALRRILHGESTKPGATHFFVFNSTMSTVLDPIYEPIDLSIDVGGRHADLRIPSVVDATCRPIIGRFTGEPVRSIIRLPAGFEYTEAQVANGNTTSSGEVRLKLENTHSHLNVMHMTQDGVVR
jgi:hypothetical protein